jgi:hypothetical protein
VSEQANGTTPEAAGTPPAGTPPAGTPPADAGSSEPAVVAPLHPRSPAARAEVQAARADLDAARQAFGGEVEQLQQKGREAVDIKAKVKNLPQTLAKDPRKIGVVAAAGAGLAGLVALRRRGGPKPNGTLPPEVEQALAGMGKDGKKMREALDRSFAEYLKTQGLKEPAHGRGIPRSLVLALIPIGTQVAREVIKRQMRRTEELSAEADQREAERTGG